MSKPKSRKVAALLAFVGAIAPISGFHKVYMGQPVWAALYLLMSFTPIPRVASVVEGVWYLMQDGDEFDRRFNAGVDLSPAELQDAPNTDPAKVGAIAEAVRELDQLRADGLISEYEFEQKRRQLLDQIA